MASSEHYIITTPSGPLSGTCPTSETAEEEARGFLEKGGRGPATIVKCTEAPVKRLTLSSTITETDLTTP